MFASLKELLIAQSIATTVVLLIFLLFLLKKGLFNWTTTGFWSWNAFGIYFLVNPLFSTQWNVDAYRVNLQISGGLARGTWIGIVSLAGMSAFFISYLAAQSKPVTWGLPPRDTHLTPIMKLLMLGFIAVASISFLTYRTGGSAALDQGRFVIAGGRFTGSTTGYQNSAHIFMFIPAILLMLSPSRTYRLLGFLLTGTYVVMKLSDAWGRWALISFLIAMSIAAAVYNKRKWPPLFYLAAIPLLAAILIVRGHTSIGSNNGIFSILTKIPELIGPKLANNNTSMLPTWYLVSYIRDHITGYTYGLPLINYTFFGFIPSRIFPQKYFLLTWLQANQPPILDASINASLLGAKWSLLGSFYDTGGILGVILLAGIMGILSRKLDGMLSADSPLLVKATGICWISTFWIMWAGQDYWAVQVIGTIAMPAILLWLASPKIQSRRKSKPLPVSTLETQKTG